MQTSNEQLEKISNTLSQAATDINTMVRDTTNASLQSISVLVKGYSDLCNSLSSIAQKQIDQSSNLVRTMMSTTNVNDLVNTQNTLLKSNLDDMMSDMSNITALSTRIAQQAAEPVTKVVNESISKFSKVKAA